ncbi:pfs domain-containing protein [Colletotrichum scovillei]|nr:pfs domain-containing protein [Colletotrichum scovillei]
MDIESLVDRLARRNAFLIGLVRWYRRLHPTRPHGFTINAFIVDGVTQPVPAPYFPILLGSWRLMACLIFCNSIVVYSFIFYSVWSSPSLVITSVLIVQVIAFIFRTLGIGSGTFTIGSLLSSVGHYYATSCLVFVSKVSSFWPSIWSYFWFTYCLFAIRRRRFSQNYHEAWKLKYPGHFIPVFIGRSDCVRVPLPGPDEPEIDDLQMWKHLSFFYRLYRIEGGFSQVLLPKALIRFEIVEITDDIYKGPLVSVFDVPQRILRLVENETPTSVPAGHDPRRDIRELRRASVYRDLAQADSLKGLRFVVGWDTTLISIVVLLPTIISIATAVAWPIVAVLKYEADVQTSVQTGVTVGSFIVTAGALLIGLVTLFDALAKHLSTTHDQLELTVKVEESLTAAWDLWAYTIGWIAALDKELTAALAMLDERHQQPENFVQNQRDTNSYSWGRIGAHNVIITSLAEGSYGLVSAATTANGMILSLPHIRFGLMVGIGAGIPRLEDGIDIRLGDVVVSRPTDGSSGVIQYDLGKLKGNGEFQRVGSLAPPPAVLLKGLAKLKADQRLNGNQLPRILADALKLFPRLAKPRGNDAAFIHQGAQNDRLFTASSTHVQVRKLQSSVHSEKQVSMNFAQLAYHHICISTAWIWGMIVLLFFFQRRPENDGISADSVSSGQVGEARLQSITKIEACEYCNPKDELRRDDRPDTDPEIHYGIIASGNSVVKDGVSRDQILQQLGTGCLCFEMEAAGLMNDFPCLVIRGICDYADSHKSDRWQNYAAIVAAAYAKELLMVMEAMNVEQTKTVGDIMGKVSQIEATTRETFEKVEQWNAGDRSGKLHSWLSAPDPSIDHNKASNLHHEGTGQWFLDTKKYLLWKTNPGSSLWLYGGPGCGKTILSSTIIRDLRDSKGICLYFYFTFTNTEKQSLDGAIRSLIEQLYRQSKAAREYLDSVFESRGASSSQPDIDSLCSWFNAMLGIAGEVWIVLDALDERDLLRECQQGHALKNKGLLQWIKILLESEGANFHILVTSRQEEDIRRVLKDIIPKDMQISLRNMSVNKDIRAFIRSTLKTWGDLPEWRNNQSSRGKVEQYLSGNANGITVGSKGKTVQTLQLAHFSVKEYLLSGRMEPRFLRAFEERFAKSAMARVCLAYLLSMDYSLLPAEFESSYPLAPYAAQYWARYAARADHDAISDLVREFLCHRYCYGVCFQLSQFGLEDDHEMIDERSYRRRKRRHPNLCLEEHLRRDEELLEDGTLPNTYMDAGMQIYHEWSFEEKDGSPPHLLHFCVFEGLGFAVEEILKTNPEYVNAKSGNGATALQVAALHGHAEVVVLLLNKGADLHAKDGRRGTALQAASFNGHEDVVEILLDKGADPNIQGGRLDTPLQAAALNGHRGIGELLLDRGADCNAQGGEYGTALQAASYKGHDGVANILIGKGADLNAQGGKFGTALVAAAASGHKTIVRLLIKKGADANAQASIPCKTALWVAALNLHEEIVRILLDEGAVANLSSIGAEILAHYWETVIEVLRVRGVEIGEKGWQASWRSKMISHQTILMLLGKMFVADTVAYFSNVLVPASGEGHLDIAQALIELGAKTNATDAHGMSALSLAAANGHENIVKLLLHHEALSFIKVDYKCHPLYTASCGNQVKIIKLMPLNDIGADTVYESIVSALQHVATEAIVW